MIAAVAVVIGAVVGAVLSTTAHPSRSPPRSQVVQPSEHNFEAQAVWQAHKRRAPNFLLRDQANRPFSLSSQRGRVVLLTFFDSHCKKACPLEGRLVGDIQRAFERTRRPALVVVDVNPWADTAASTRAAARKWRFASPWHWARGRRPTLARVWDKYDIAVQRGAGDISHSTAVYVLDQSGYERLGYLFPFTVRSVSAAVRALEREQSRSGSHSSS